jgi:transcriptional regulator GlxA family with amidase domain
MSPPQVELELSALLKQGGQKMTLTFVRRLRLDEARQRLSAPECTVEGVARSVGFGDGDNFRRAFERSFGIAPSAYRGRFAARH